MTTASLHFFKTEVIVNQTSASNDGHTVFEVINKSIDPNSQAFERIKTPFTDNSLSASPSNLFFSVQTLCEVFPFHFIFKRNFNIVEMGNSLRRYVRLERSSVIKRDKRIMFSDMFIISRPIIELTFEAILEFTNHLFLLTTREEYVKNINNKKEADQQLRNFTLSPERMVRNARLSLKGQMISLPAFDALLFVGSPALDDLGEMMRLDITYTDFPVHDAAGRHLMVRSTRSDDQEVISKIDLAANHLKIVEKKLRYFCNFNLIFFINFLHLKRSEIAKNHRILNEMFPPKISRILCQGIKVDAEHYEMVTCLYSDIVNFTAMCSSPIMKAIDIIRLLNR